MDIKVYHTLHKDAVKIRKEVFMEEQGFHDELKNRDFTMNSTKQTRTLFILSCT